MRKMIALLALVLVAAACGGDDDGAAAGNAAPETAAPETTASPPETTAAPATTEAPAATEAPSSDLGTLAVVSSELGEILVDGAGNTLYLFVPDDQGPSVCYDGCAALWPPLVGEATAGDGVDEALLGVVARDDGSEQVTYNGWPLYYFASDTAPGDTNGQGANDVWYVLSATGEPIAG